MTEKILREMAAHFGEDVRRINHAVKVFGFAQAIGRLEGLPEDVQLTLELAAILHDIGIHEAEKKHGSTAGPYQELEGPPIAETILKRCGADAALIPRVLELVGSHHSYGRIDGPDFQILVEADFIVNIFEDSMRGTPVRQIIEKYFKTETGKRLALSMYPA